MTPLSWAAFCASLISIGYLIIDAVKKHRKNNDDEKNEEDNNEQKEDTE